MVTRPRAWVSGPPLPSCAGCQSSRSFHSTPLVCVLFSILPPEQRSGGMPQTCDLSLWWTCGLSLSLWFQQECSKPHRVYRVTGRHVLPHAKLLCLAGLLKQNLRLLRMRRKEPLGMAKQPKLKTSDSGTFGAGSYFKEKILY